ncbi:Uncharacterized protein BM_BM11608 [Brugia malayi]|uniref:ANK_REP_REGION domain-containing protein n=1 Tax=Brugia malayi TaxID=6279 RepID=A0A4E9F2R6_BRUMA|nr:Uncharacterized protein BM_BM11608 [Brugia malayi]VIO90375.1 Uncharacterized protein BM_BM11608 [Brugia malayi]
MAAGETETKQNEDLECCIMNLDFDAKKFTELEDLQITGKLQEVGHIVAKHLDNEHLMQYITRFRKQQNRLNAAMAAIEENQLKKLKNLLDSLSLIHFAVCKERHEIVEYLASVFPKSIDILDANGRAAVHYAAIQKNAIYDTLIDCGADGSLPDSIGVTAAQYRENSNAMIPSPLTSSTNADLIFKRYSLSENLYDPVNQWLEDGNVKQLEQIFLDGRGYLLADKISNDIATSQFLKGSSKYQDKIDMIHKAAEEGDIEQMIALIDNDKFSVARDRYGMTPLHIAILHGQTNTVRYLLAKYPSCVNATNHTGRTALHYAFANRANEVMVNMLQKAGADAFIEDKFGHTALYYQNNENQLDVKMMIKDNDQMNELLTGQMSGPLLQELEEDISEWIHTSNLRRLDDLVLNGYANLLSGRTYEVDDPDIRRFLDTLPQYQNKIDAIHKAIEADNLRTIKILIDRKKMAFCRDARHLTPLHKAIVLNQIDIAKFLIKNYPQVTNALDENKRTPLHYAAALSDGGYMYKKMRDVGANSKICDCNGRKPSYYLNNPEEIDLKAINADREIILDEIIRSRITTSYLQSNIRQWLHDGNISKLEQLVLSGCGDLLFGHTTSNSNSNIFLNQLNTYLDEIDEIHKAIKRSDLKRVKELINSKKLAIARNRLGHTPLHTAIIYEQTEIIRHIVSNFPSVLNASDYNRRTPMHYAAATRDGGHYVKILIKAGADSKATDNEGHTPHYYGLNNVINLELLKETDNNDDNNAISENFIPEQPQLHTDSVLSSGSASVISSSNVSPRGREQNETDDEDKFEYDEIVSPTSSNAVYLARTIAPILTKALTETLLRRPIDPIAFIANWLTQYREKNP